MKTIAYTCKICGGPGQADYDDSQMQLDIAKWTKMLTHNHCYDFMDRKRLLGEDIWKTCYDFGLSKALTDSDKRVEAAKRTREALVRKTKSFAKLICDFYRKPLAWEPDWPQMHMDAPDKCHQLLAHYERGIRT